MSSKFKKRLRMTRKQRKADDRRRARLALITVSELNRCIQKENDCEWRAWICMKAIFGEIERSPYE